MPIYTVCPCMFSLGFYFTCQFFSGVMPGFFRVVPKSNLLELLSQYFWRLDSVSVTLTQATASSTHWRMIKVKNCYLRWTVFFYHGWQKSWNASELNSCHIANDSFVLLLDVRMTEGLTSKHSISRCLWWEDRYWHISQTWKWISS